MANWRCDSFTEDIIEVDSLEEMPDRGAFPVRLWPEEEEEGLRELGEVLRLPLRRQEVRGDQEHGFAIG